MAEGIGGLALTNMFAEDAFALPQGETVPGLPSLPHFAPKAKRCIYLHMMGAPPQMDLLDYKPKMANWYETDRILPYNFHPSLIFTQAHETATQGIF